MERVLQLRQFLTSYKAPGPAQDSTLDALSLTAANQSHPTAQGPTIAELSQGHDVLVLFLRHSGCTFCREALADLAARRSKLEAAGMTPVVVHMSQPQVAQAMFDSYGLGDVFRISDPGQQLYRAYGLTRGSVKQLLGPKVWWRGFLAALVDRHGFGKLDGDGFQLPGVFVVRDNQIVKAYRHATAADRPDVCEFALGTSHQ